MRALQSYGLCGALSLAGLLAAPSAISQDSAKQVVTPPKIELEIFPSTRRKPLDAGFDILVTVSNVTGEGIRARGMMICYEGQLEGLIPNLKSEVGPPSPGPRDVPPNCQRLAPVQLGELSQEPTLRSGQQGHYRARIAPQSIFVEGRMLNLPLLFMSRGEYVLDAFFKYETLESAQDAKKAGAGEAATAVKVTRMLRQTKRIDLDPPVEAGYLGVLAGVLLVAFFMANRAGQQIEGVTTEYEGPRPPLPTILKNAILNIGYGTVRIAGIAVIGILTGFIMVVLLNQTDAPQLPISVSINDFWGGAFLGLVALRFASWIDTAILGRSPKPTPRTPEKSDPSATDPPGAAKPG